MSYESPRGRSLFLFVQLSKRNRGQTHFPSYDLAQDRSPRSHFTLGSYDNTYSRMVPLNLWSFPRFVPKDKSNLNLLPCG
jgi:hypothetical protein